MSENKADGNGLQDEGVEEGVEEVDFTAFEEDLGEPSPLLKLQEQLEQAQDDLARSRAETFNVQQEYGNYVRRTKSEAKQRRDEGSQAVIELLLPVLDDIEAARAAGDLAEGPFASIAEKLEEALATGYGVERFGVVGDVFDPQLHDALMANTNPEVTETVISQVLQSGFRLGDQVLRPTKVIVDNPE